MAMVQLHVKLICTVQVVNIKKKKNLSLELNLLQHF